MVSVTVSFSKPDIWILGIQLRIMRSVQHVHCVYITYNVSTKYVLYKNAQHSILYYIAAICNSFKSNFKLTIFSSHIYNFYNGNLELSISILNTYILHRSSRSQYRTVLSPTYNFLPQAKTFENFALETIWHKDTNFSCSNDTV